MRIAPFTLRQETLLLSSRMRLIGSLLTDELVTRGHIVDLS
jgi:hypothetical protein